MFFARSLLIVSAVAGVLAQDSGVSTQCQNTIIAVAASPSAACLNPSDLIQVFVKGATSSVVTPVDTWLKGLCALGPCSNDDLSTIVTNITAGCSTEFQSILSGTQITTSDLPAIVQKVYPTVRKGVCLADASKNNQLCVTQTLSTVESATGTLTTDKLGQTIDAMLNGQTIQGINLCTPCVKQIYNVAKTDFPATFGQGDIFNNLQANCGASFVDGASDPNIVETASDKTTTSGKSSSGAGGSVQVTGQQALLSTFLLGVLALAA